MNPHVETAQLHKRSFYSITVQPIINAWNRIINIGIDDQTSHFDKKRTRLINGICTWAFLIFLTYVIAFADIQKARFIFWESVVGVIGYSIPVLINHYRRYNLACHLFNIFDIFFYLFMSIAEGGLDGVEYIFVPSCVSAMFFFKSSRVVFLYFFANFCCFGIAKISHSLMSPIFVYEGQKYLVISNYITMFFILFLQIFYFKSENSRQEKLLEKRNESLAEEKQKSDNLLLNILPHETAEELKHTGQAKSRSFDMVTVMFTDFRNFTNASEKMAPEELVSQIHYYFSVFDGIMGKYKIEKIKTIGDSYMCAGGIPEANSTHALDVVNAALEIQEFMQALKKEKVRNNEHYFELRLGVHTGPVVAGIVGTRKFAYDIWGDTVNIASRMESSGEVGKVNISGSTYERIKNQFNCIYRGKVPAKNKGEVDMYFVDRASASVS